MTGGGEADAANTLKCMCHTGCRFHATEFLFSRFYKGSADHLKPEWPNVVSLNL